MKMSSKYLLYILLILGGWLIIHACSPERFYTEPDAMIGFSTDTLRFDTVFTQKGSATRILKIYNPYDRSLIIERIYVASGAASQFRLNIDGLPGNEGDNYNIAPNDSMYIFAEVTVDPDLPLSMSPFVLEDHIVFETNGNEQRVLLEAWGQNANYIPTFNAQGQQALLSCNLGEVVWGDPKPYVIYGVLAIDSCTLTIPEGAQLYVHGGFVRTTGNDFYNDGIIVTLRNGKLNIKGTRDNPVTIQSDRTESEFEFVPGQFSGIRLGSGSRGPHNIEYLDIRHGIVGVYADSAAVVNIKNSKFSYCSSAGLAGVHARINAENCLFHDNDGGAVAMIYGGNYDFRYCTFSNLNNTRDAIAAQNFICYDPPSCTDAAYNPLNLEVVNSIIVNAGRDAIGLGNAAPDEPNGFNYRFENCLVNVDELPRNERYLDFFDRCDPCTLMERGDPLFLDIEIDDFSLDTMSVARGLGKSIPGIQGDILGNMRKMPPDVGCYEFIE